jgi:hypothetical protein
MYCEIKIHGRKLKDIRKSINIILNHLEDDYKEVKNKSFSYKLRTYDFSKTQELNNGVPGT